MPPTKIVSLVDPALDIEAMGSDLNRYIESRDVKLVKEAPGARLQWITLRDIKTSTWSSFVSVGASDSEQRRRAFMVAVESVDNLVDREGKLRAGLTTGTQRYMTPGGEMRVWSDAEIDELFAPAIVEDVGEVARVRAIVPFGSELRLVPPPSSLAALLARVRRRAVALGSELDRSAALKETQGAKSSPSGDAPTAAPATGTATESPAEPPTP